MTIVSTIKKSIKAIVIKIPSNPQPVVLELVSGMIDHIPDLAPYREDIMGTLGSELPKIPDWQLRAYLWFAYDKLRKYWGEERKSGKCS